MSRRTVLQSTRIAIAAFMASLTLGGCAGRSVADGPHSVTFRGASLSYTNYNAAPDAPDEPALVLVHGWASAQVFWADVLEGLRGKRRVITLDLPGHGASEDVPDEHSMDLYAEAIAAILDDAHVQRAVMVGHSNGTPTVRQFERRYPERTAGLVAVDGGLRLMFSREQMEPFFAQVRGPRFREFTLSFIEQFRAQGMSESDIALIRDVMLATPQRVMVGGMEAGADPAIWEEADPMIGVPLLIINTDAPMWTDDYKTYARSLGEDVEYVTMSEVTHFLFMDKPDEFNRILLAWLADRGL